MNGMERKDKLYMKNCIECQHMVAETLLMRSVVDENDLVSMHSPTFFCLQGGKHKEIEDIETHTCSHFVRGNVIVVRSRGD